jgi:hypothetical protein
MAEAGASATRVPRESRRARMHATPTPFLPHKLPPPSSRPWRPHELLLPALLRQHCMHHAAAFLAVSTAGCLVAATGGVGS